MKYIAYVRKSTDEKDKQILSIDQQVAELKEYALKQNLDILDFVCEARTAKTIGRPLFAEMLKRIENGDAQGIVSWHPDRLARNSIDGGKIIYSLDTGKLIDLKFPSFWFENSPQGKFVLNMAFGQSKYYVDNLSENVKRGMRHKVRLGIWPVEAPLGYLNDKNTKTIVVDPTKSKILKKCFEMFAEGKHSFSSISEFLYKNGVVTRLGRKINPSTIKRKLSNRFYLGILDYKGELHKGIHKPIISKALFDAVQRQIDRIEKPRYKLGKNFSFIGLARCGECGGAITGEEHIKKLKISHKKVRYVYYRCSKKFGVCNQKYISETNLAKQLRRKIKSIFVPDQWKEKWLALLEQDKVTESVKAKENTALTEVELQATETKLNKLLNAYLESVISEEDYKIKKNELFNIKLQLQEKIEETKQHGNNWLEPLEHFIMSAFQAQKIAQEKNELQNLSNFVRSACSNFFLIDQHLQFSYNLGYSTLNSVCGSPHPATFLSDISESVTPMRFELMISWMRTKCPRPLDDGANSEYYSKYKSIMACYLKSKTLIDISNQLKITGKDIVLTHGAFDLFHVGQMEFLKQSKKLGDYLIVGVDSDERIQRYKDSNRPIIPLEQRIEILLENRSIDFIFAINENNMDNNFFLKLYHQFNPSVLTCGVNFAYQKNFQERQKLFKECNFKQITHKYDYQSTTKIINKIANRYSNN